MEFWLVVGREMNKNQLKHLIIKSNTGQMRQMTQHQLHDFSKKNRVINIKFAGDQMQGVGISLLSIPTYKKNDMGFMEQVSGTSEQQIITQGMQVANQIMAKEQQKQNNNNNKEIELKNKRVQYLIDKLNICNTIVDTALQMKDLTNNQVLLDNISRYLKQIDIDNTGDDIGQMIQKYGVNGLANGLDGRLQRIKERARKFNLQNEQLNGITILSAVKTSEDKVEHLRKKHAETHKLVKDNKKQEEKIIKLEKEQEKEEENAIIIDDEPDNEIIIDEDTEENSVQIEEDNMIKVDECEENSIEIKNENETDEEEYYTLEYTGERLRISKDTYKTVHAEQAAKVPKLVETYYEYISNEIRNQLGGITITKERYREDMNDILNSLVVCLDWKYIMALTSGGEYSRCIQFDECIEDINTHIIEYSVNIYNRYIKEIKEYRRERLNTQTELDKLQEELKELKDIKNSNYNIDRIADLKNELRRVVKDELCQTFVRYVIKSHGEPLQYYNLVGNNVIYCIAEMLNQWNPDIHIGYFGDNTIKTWGRSFNYNINANYISSDYRMCDKIAYKTMIDVLGKYKDALPEWFKEGVIRICRHFEDDPDMNGKNSLKKASSRSSSYMSSFYEERISLHRRGINKFIDSVVDAASQLTPCQSTIPKNNAYPIEHIDMYIRHKKGSIELVEGQISRLNKYTKEHEDYLAKYYIGYNRYSTYSNYNEILNKYFK